MTRTEQHLAALGTFKDWSNYLLVTTVAALGWVALPNHVDLSIWMRDVVMACFGASICCGILTLALIPHVATGVREHNKSFYQVRVQIQSLWLVGEPRWSVRLMLVCAPQHVLFLAGIVFFTVGAILHSPSSATHVH
jgi:hypothetical protein